jgi:nitrite reductase (NO-forming)
MISIGTVRVAMVLAAIIVAGPALADDLKLPRQSVALVQPPFVHPHEQATKEGPKILEFRLVTEEKQIVIDDEGRSFRP